MKYFDCIGTCKQVSAVFEDEMPMFTRIGELKYYIDVDTKTKPEDPFCYAYDAFGRRIKNGDDLINMWKEHSDVLKACDWEHEFGGEFVLHKISFELAYLNQCIVHIEKEHYNLDFYRGIDVLRESSKLLKTDLGLVSKNYAIWVKNGSPDFECRIEDDYGHFICDDSGSPVNFWDTGKNDFTSKRYKFFSWNIALNVMYRRRKVLYRAFNRLCRELDACHKPEFSIGG